ncbi:GlsB/YeaQ/YmgE family stress response membrane protein [Flavobacterium agricola]|uniref:GlsB/YeaQ/YmgE family stress response membrane protein n=1 Tax=Flavobacterium agricola TaxID=2870839 RepID=A0ABY6M1J7_9FLAO|nr:GlsB/YeaQ/YmgE family stress response membrane protein [Flavobacterium agricola]UYW01677.1 GlsB/YeaQ/YmgE family stress response membrane protein [Flavobacterium agricola]
MNIIYLITIGIVSGLLAHYCFIKSGLGLLANIIIGLLASIFGFGILAVLFQLSFFCDGYTASFLSFVSALTILSFSNIISRSIS